ncbi:hypothetical protein [Anaerosolibacter sp.]|uniref:hypothetical protein n=1 Tax=Anaerosolibacter sp. TaxID=1872527 RepID=UPI0039F11E48
MRQGDIINFEILNVLILSIGGLIGLWETLLLAMGKKVLKGSSEIVGIANLGVLIYGLNNFLYNPLYQILSSFAVILAFLTIRY